MLPLGEALARAWQCHQAGDLEQAGNLYRYVLAEVHNQLGICRAQQDKPDDAAVHFRHATELWPGAAGPLSNLGNVLRSQGKLDEAEDCARQAVALQPQQAEAYNSLGLILLRQGQLDEAQKCFRQAVSLKPDYSVAHSNFLLTLNYNPNVDLDVAFAEHRRFGAQYATPSLAHANHRDPERRLRIGYVSPDLCEHVVSGFMLPIFKNHDPAQVQVVCYAEVVQPDAMTAALQRFVHGWRFTHGWSDAQLAEAVRNDGIDILIDLAGHTGGNRLRVFGLKPAPVQVTYLGYPATTGLSSVDYRLTDATADPPGEPSRYTEELMRLPDCFCCYAPPAAAPQVTPLPALTNGHVTFAALHDLAKVNERVVALWCELLRAVPTARLMIFRHTLRGRTADRFRRQFDREEIAPERVELAHAVRSGAGFLNLYQNVDILLDVFPWNGHGTCCEALWMGVPLVTLSGNSHAGRLSTTLLTALGLTDLAAHSPQEYVRLAADLAGDLERLGQFRLGLRQRMASSILCDGAGFTRNLEAAYRQMWRRWCANVSR